MNMTLVELRSAADEYFRRHLSPEARKLLPEEVMTVRIAVGGDEERTIEID